MSNPTNPYIAGNPITGSEMFFGRQDVFRFIRETLVGRYQDNAIVLYGGRRTGKTLRIATTYKAMNITKAKW